MLTHTNEVHIKRKDRPWLLLIMALIWVGGTTFFHSAWEPYEPFVFAVVKSILSNHSWLIPHVSNIPYTEIQPFYFWIYSALIKLLAINIHDIETIANAVRIINTLIIFAAIALSGKIGSSLMAYKNGRTVVLILISTIGFINDAYQLSPNMIILLGVALYIYALQLHNDLPGISGGILFVSLFLVSLNFTGEFVAINLITLIMLPITSKAWRSPQYFITSSIGVILFISTFYLYCLVLQKVNNDFFLQWQQRYLTIFAPSYSIKALIVRFGEINKTLLWYILPSWFLVFWSIYKRRLLIFSNKSIQVAIILSIFIYLFTLFTQHDINNSLFPLVLTSALIGSIEVDSIRITIVALLNWFCIFTFGIIGLVLWGVYCIFLIKKPVEIIDLITQLSQQFTFSVVWWRIMLALVITFIWFFMITRRHIRGREMITNWASGTTCVVILFLSLWLPWFDGVLTFRPIVSSSLTFINPKQCIATNEEGGSQSALWYYYANVNLLPSFVNNINYSVCTQALIASDDIDSFIERINSYNTASQQKTVKTSPSHTIHAINNHHQWHIIWSKRRPIDKKTYYLLQ